MSRYNHLGASCPYPDHYERCALPEPARRAKPYALPLEAIRALEDARYWTRELAAGTRDPYGIYPRTPLPPAMRRDLATVERAIGRLMNADKALRR